MKTRAEIENGLAQCYGSEENRRHWTGRILYTEGVQYLAESAGAYWLIDVVASYQRDRRLKGCQGFQLWELKVNLEEKTGVVTVRMDSDTTPLITQSLVYTDFPLPQIKLYCEGDAMPRTLLLPSEH
jgi:hypothetical protein